MILQQFLIESDDVKKTEYLQEIGLYIDKQLELLNYPDNKNCVWAIKNLSKKKLGLSLKENEKFKNFISSAINSQDDKIRKNAYVILGNVDSDFCHDLLIKAIDKETVFYCYPCIVLSLGNFKDFPNCERFFKKCQELFENGQMPEKFFLLVKDAFEKAFPKKTCPVKNVKINAEDKILLTTQKSYFDLFIKNLGKKCEKTKFGVTLRNLNQDDFSEILSRKDYYDLFFLYAITDDFSEKNITLAVTAFKEFVKRNTSLPVGYRIECKSDIKEKEKITKLVKNLCSSCDLLVNNPSDYSFTFYVQTAKNGEKGFIAFKCDFLFKNRFPYRKNCLPASINPVTANIIANVAKSFSAPKSVCDCFCGTAPLLLARARTVNANFFGSDINENAVEMAKENCALANVQAKIIRKNVALLSGQFDEIISNLPYGLRVGNHENNFEIYSYLAKKCKTVLNKNGFAFLYTADKACLRKLLKQNGLTIINEMPMESGGLYCSLFIVKNCA